MKLHFRSYGEGFPVIILHGLFGTLDNWYTVSKKLADTYRVFALDLRNHGRSPHHRSHTYDDLANDLYFFMHEQNIDSAHLLGHSMGGTAAMQFTAQRPDMVDRLIVVDMAPRDYTPRHDELFNAFDAIDPWQFSRRNEIDEALERYLPDNAVRQYLLKNITRGGDNRFTWKFNLKAIRENYQSVISGPDIEGTISHPVLFIKGERSSYITGDDERRIANLFPNAEIKTIPDAGHWVHSDAPQLFLDAVRSFLDKGN